MDGPPPGKAGSPAVPCLFPGGEGRRRWGVDLCRVQSGPSGPYRRRGIPDGQRSGPGAWRISGNGPGHVQCWSLTTAYCLWTDRVPLRLHTGRPGRADVPRAQGHGSEAADGQIASACGPASQIEQGARQTERERVQGPQRAGARLDVGPVFPSAQDFGPGCGQGLPSRLPSRKASRAARAVGTMAWMPCMAGFNRLRAKKQPRPVMMESRAPAALARRQ